MEIVSSIAITAVMAVVAVAAVYYLYAQPTCYLLIDGHALRLHGSKITVGREDFASFLPPNKLAYIARKAVRG